LEPLIIVIVVVAALLGGLALGWILGGRVGRAGAETTTQLRAMLNEVVEERDSAKDRLARLEASGEERERGFDEQVRMLSEAKELLSAQFGEIGQKLLGEAQQAFLQRADERFHQAGEKNEEKIKQLLMPVGERLKAYEEQVGRIEKDRTEAYGALTGLIEQMRAGQERVQTEAARLVNSCSKAAGFPSMSIL
jgi:DNA recombination protein RmuC